jgi:hypothetical protein
MLRQLLFGGAISLGNIAIHSLAMVVVISAARTAAVKRQEILKTRLIAVMIAVVSVLLLAHLGEIAVWSFAYALLNVAANETDQLYFAFVNFTTLGYGDVVPLPRWRLLGPMTAMNGVLLFGWSTAVMFEVLRITIRLPPGE